MFEDYSSKSHCLDLILDALESKNTDLLVAKYFSKFNLGNTLKLGYHCTKTMIEEGKLGAYSPFFLGAALGADHEAETIGKIRDSKGRRWKIAIRVSFDLLLLQGP